MLVFTHVLKTCYCQAASGVLWFYWWTNQTGLLLSSWHCGLVTMVGGGRSHSLSPCRRRKEVNRLVHIVAQKSHCGMKLWEMNPCSGVCWEQMVSRWSVHSLNCHSLMFNYSWRKKKSKTVKRYLIFALLVNC